MSELAEIKSLLEKIDGRLQRVEDIEAIRPNRRNPAVLRRHAPRSGHLNTSQPDLPI